MSTKKKLLQAAAGSAGGGGLNVEEVFSTDLWKGNGSTQTITNGIDISGEGGLVWIHSRSRGGEQHILTDTENGQGKALDSSSTSALSTTTESVQNLNSDGYSFTGDLTPLNRSPDTYVGWTFRKAPKFFDVVEYSYQGNTVGTTAQIAHNLGSAPGLILIKAKDKAESFIVWHKDVNGYFKLAETSSVYTGTGAFGSSPSMTDTHFSVGYDGATNFPNYNYVAYLFAHNDGDGGFGPDGDADIIKCGSYTGNASNSAGPTIDLGFEPQWVMIKSVDSAYDWFIADTMRGWTATHPKDDNLLRANSSSAETANTEIGLVNSTGFQIMGGGAEINGSGQTYIYIAIRRGPMAVPTDATEVFDVELANATTTNGVEFQTGWPVDFAWFKDRDTGTEPFTLLSRLQGNTRYMFSSSTGAETTGVSYGTFDHSDGWYSSTLPSDYYSCMWRRAPNFFDVVAYGATGETNPSVSHNLGVAPEMIWHKERDSSGSWSVAHSYDFTKRLVLDSTSAEVSYQFVTNITDTSFNINFGGLGAENSNKIMYLFASLAGVSKVGSYTGNGSTQNIDCGFSSGARFVLIKCSSDGLTDWHVMDSTRGIVAGNDPWLMLNDTAAEDTGEDIIDPYSSGFALPANNRVNTSGRTYIFYAIA